MAERIHRGDSGHAEPANLPRWLRSGEADERVRRRNLRHARGRPRTYRAVAETLRRLRHDPELRTRLGNTSANDAQLRTPRALRDAPMPGPDQADRSIGIPCNRQQGSPDGKSRRRNPESNPRLQRRASEAEVGRRNFTECET